MLRYAAVAALVLFGAVTARPSSADVSGEPTVIDGDTIVVAGERVRLEGIDAPEMHQTCTAYGQEWACGRTSAKWLRAGKSGASATPVIGTAGWSTARLNERIVREGLALDFRRYLTDYPQAELVARRADAGIWWASSGRRGWRQAHRVNGSRNEGCERA